jgi:hypothetical protein
MKRKCFFTVILCALFCPLWGQPGQKLADFDLKNAVKSMTESEYQVDNYDYKQQRLLRETVIVFNISGYKTDEEYVSPEGEVLFRNICTYTPSNELVEEKGSDFGSNKNFLKTYKTEGKKIVVTFAYDGQPVKLFEDYQFDAKNKLAQSTEYDENEGVYRIRKYTYNADGLVQYESMQMQDTKLNFQYVYNKHKQVHQKMEVNASGKISHTQTFAYTAEGHVASEETSYSVDPDKIVMSYKYTVDKNGNWTEKQEYMDGKLISVTKRKLTYY